MALLIVPKKVLVFLRQYFSQQPLVRRKLTRKLTKTTGHLTEHAPYLFFVQSPIPKISDLNMACFYNFPSPLKNVSTYENLVNQKCTQSDPKPPPEKDNPGRHRFHKEIESALNEQILIELNASFTYLAIASYFGRTEIALPGCQGFFMMMHEEEHKHAMIFINYILLRGGYPEIPCIQISDIDGLNDISKAFAKAVQMESHVKEKLEALVNLSEKHKDYQLIDFISAQFLAEQNQSICLMARLLVRSKMAKDKVGEFLFDKQIFDAFVSKTNMMYLKDVPEDGNSSVYK